MGERKQPMERIADALEWVSLWLLLLVVIEFASCCVSPGYNQVDKLADAVQKIGSKP